MTRADEHPAARLARIFGLALARDPRGIERLQYLAPGMLPVIPGPWTIYRF